ncbi:Hint domain-containing protein [Ochrobactrum sp. CM-21-5]|nr:Hint domain-containing protein [Ochrobactrum sp. CM-21-5]MBC2885694.1 Hint domain-containing protein [Ochrobactrum sp. CM-21-5]
MSSDKDRHSPRNRARRHFLGVAAAAATKAAALGALGAFVSSLPARAMGTKWWETGGGGSGSNCLLKGTLIQTSMGPMAVEKLEIGDLVETVVGSLMPVKWIGRQSYRKGGAHWNDSIMPIRVSRHALDGKTPHRDLYLSPNHAMFIDDVLIRVKDLVNGHSIAPAPERVFSGIDYYNIVLDSHEVMLAEGAAVETYLMQGESYKSFTNFEEYQQLYRGAPHIAMQPFAPIVGYEGPRQHLHALLCLSGVLPLRDVVEETYQRLAARAGEWAV